MTIRNYTRTFLAVAAVAMVGLLTTSAQADLVTTLDDNATVLTFAGEVSNSDLLNGLTPTVATGWNTSNNAHPDELTDGIHGVGFGVVVGDNVQGAWTNPGATATYNLGTGANGLGYDLTSINSIADWENVGFGNQVWTIELQTVGGSFSTLTTVDNQALAGGGGTTKATLTDTTGVVASGIESIRITVGSQSGHGSGAFVWRELDVFGTSTTAIPEPSSLALFGLGSVMMLVRRRRG